MPLPPQNVRKVFIPFDLVFDLVFGVLGKVSILLGFDVGGLAKVFISNK
jgi:hypothetical protein